MITVSSNLTARQLVGAMHQFEGVVMKLEDGRTFSFVPQNCPQNFEVGHDYCYTGLAFEITDEKFSYERLSAELYYRNAKTPDEKYQLDIL